MNPTTTTPKGQSAFSLIELLVVITIIGMITALLLPVFARVHDEGRRITCVSNLRQLGAAIALYAQDDDGTFVPVAEQGAIPRHWTDLVQPYVKDKSVLKCPADVATRDKYDGVSSYGLNSHLSGVAFPQFADPGLDPKQKSLLAVAKPAGTVLMTDSGTIPLAGSLPEGWPAIEPSPREIGDASTISHHDAINVIQNGALAAPRARHSGRTNVLWVDGHVTTATISAIYISPGITAPGQTIPGYSPCLRPETGCR